MIRFFRQSGAIRLLRSCTSRLGYALPRVASAIVASVVLAGAAAPPPMLPITHGRRDQRVLCLTFDACPTSLKDEYNKEVIDILLRDKVPATLFLSGRWVEKNQQAVRFLAAHPQFELANHSFYHPHLLQKNDARVLRELRRTQHLIRRLTGKTPRFFRAPFGEVDSRIVRLAASLGLTTIEYDLPSGDPDPNLSPQRIARWVLRMARGGSIIVFHVNRRGVHTAEALPLVIAGLRKEGYRFATVGELLQEGDVGYLDEPTGTDAYSQPPPPAAKP